MMQVGQVFVQSLGKYYSHAPLSPFVIFISQLQGQSTVRTNSRVVVFR